MSILRPVLAALTLLLTSGAFAQNGSLHGVVHDQESGEELIGANVLLVGTNLGAVTDLDGKYQIKSVPPGVYSVRFSYVGYTTRVVSGVDIRGGEPLKLDINLTSSSYNVEEVVSTAERVLGTEASILAERRKSSTIGDGISAEQVKKTPDVTSGDALKRVTGISVVDNKFVYIRGITDRYNETTLDGSSVTSTEMGRKGFSFDLLPANLLENTVIVKSGSPDLPGDFTGGLVQLNTLDFPDRFVAKVTMSGGSNSITTGGAMLRSQGSSTDWAAKDDGSRALPSKDLTGVDLARSLPNNWAPRATTAPYNGSFSVALGDRFDLDENTADQIGFITALTYRSGYLTADAIQDDYELGRYNAGTRNSYNVLWGAIANLSWKFGGTNKISFKNNYNRSGEDRINRFSSDDLGTNLNNQYTLTSWTQREVYSAQLTGMHTLSPLAGLEVQWRAAYSGSDRQDPDEKRVTYYRPLDDPAFPYEVAVNQRSWANLDERTLSGGADFALPVLTGKIKAGASAERRTSDYEIRYFNITPDFGAPSSLTRLPIEQVYATENYGPGKFLMSESSKPTDAYDGEAYLFAGYVMADLSFQALDQRFRLSGGARLERWDQTVTVPRTLEPGGPVDQDGIAKTDVLPSLNLTYIVSDNVNIRFAHYHSVNRPVFRERARTGYFDFVTYEIIAGNPDLDRSYIHNYDLRFEVFPGVGELFAVSLFNKAISGAIEEQLGQSATRTRTWFNSPAGNNTGFELEARKSFDFLGEYGRNLMLTFNYARIYSTIEYTVTEGNSTNTTFVTATRPMQGQAPYIINLAVLFTEPNLQTGLSISYNRSGRRLQTVGFLSSDIYEEPRDLVDVGITQPVGAGLQVKLGVRNLLDKNRVLTRAGYRYDDSTIGRFYSLELGWSL